MTSHSDSHQSTPLPASHATPIVFVVDDDISVRESLELLIRSAGLQPELFASAQKFLDHPRAIAPSCLTMSSWSE
jgi:FixJ family two-component response regulator